MRNLLYEDGFVVINYIQYNARRNRLTRNVFVEFMVWRGWHKLNDNLKYLFKTPTAMAAYYGSEDPYHESLVQF